VDLLPNESVLHQLPGIVLTNYRIRKFSGHRNGASRGREIISIRLEHITHCQTRAIDSPALIVIGSLVFLSAFIGAIAARIPLLGWIGFVVFGAYAIAYLAIKRYELVVAAPSITIKQTFPRKRFGDAITLINHIEREMISKSKRVQSGVRQEIIREIVYAPSAIKEDEETRERIVFARPTKGQIREQARAQGRMQARAREDADYWGG